ncbi:MAG: hypothetical protein ABEJ28_00095 [Salinigranum sp.]
MESEGTMREVKRRVLDAAHAVGLGPQLVRAYDGLADLRDFDVDPRIRDHRGEPERPRGEVLFPVVEGHSRNAYRYYLFAHAFRLRGYRPVFVLCNADLDLCMRKAPDWSGDTVCDLCHHLGREMADAFGFDPIPLADLVDPNATYDLRRHGAPDPELYRGIDVATYAKASVRKHLRKYHLDLQGDDRKTYRRFLRSACRLVDATYELLDRYDVRTCFGHDNAYVYGGVPLAVADARGVTGYSHMRGFRDETIIFGRTTNRSTLPWFEDDALVRDLLDTPLTDEQTREIEDLMRGRESGDAARHRYSSTMERSIRRDEGTTVAGMFTNLIWDASLEVDVAPYPDVFEWIADTIEWYADRPDAHLVVKPHPAETKRGTNESVARWIEDRYAPLPENVTLLSPDTDVNTYELIRDIDVCLVYNSTVGLESAYNGTPVIVTGDTDYRGFGFTYDFDDPSEYPPLLERAADLEVTSEMRERAVRYAYHIFVRKHIRFPFYGTDNESFEVRLRPVSHDDVTPGNEPFDRIVERSLRGEAILQPGLDEGS